MDRRSRFRSRQRTISKTQQNSSNYEFGASGLVLSNPRNPVDALETRHEKPDAPEKARRVNALVERYGKQMIDAIQADPSLTVEKYISNLREEATKQLGETKETAPRYQVYDKRYGMADSIYDAESAKAIIEDSKKFFSLRNPDFSNYRVVVAQPRFINKWLSLQHNQGTDKMLFANYVSSVMANNPTPIPGVPEINYK